MSSFRGPAARRCRRARFVDEAAARTAAIAVGPPWRARHCASCGAWHISSDEVAHFWLPPHLGRAVIRGEKTTHRVPAGRLKHCPYREGHAYPLEYDHVELDEVAGHDRRLSTTDALVHVTAATREPLEDIDDDKAAAEGFKSFAEFLDYWSDTHGDLTDRRMAADVWVITFNVEHQDPVHLLAHEISAGAAYTTTPSRALPQEPEAIDPATIAALPLSRDAQHRWQLEQLERNAAFRSLPLAAQVAHIQALADRNGVDVRGPLREIARQVERARRRLPDAA